MKKQNKRGFTIVELIIVIAVIAILAAVLIPTFTRVIHRANESRDSQLVRNLNTALATDKVLNGEHKTMYAALGAAKVAGYDVGRINASATDNEILWDSVNDCFVYVKNVNATQPEFEYIPNSKTVDNVPVYKFWKIFKASEVAAVENSPYSLYLAEGELDSFEAHAGFDLADDASVASLTYVNDADQDVVIRTNSQFTDLTVEAPNDVVTHYGVGKTLVITAVASSSFHEKGSWQAITLTSGNLVIETGSFV